MSDIILNWGLFVLAFSTFLGLGASVMSMSPPEFAFAKWCFGISAFLAAARLGWWLAVEQTLTTDDIKVGLATFALFGCIGLLWVGSLRWVENRQKALVPQKQEAAEIRVPFFREVITASQLEGNAIVLTHTPDPETVRLMVNGASYVPQTSPGMVVRGRKIFLENIPGDVPLLTLLREEIPKRLVVVEYYRDPSARDIGQRDKSTQTIPTVTSTPQISSTQISSTGQSGKVNTNYGNITTINYPPPEKPERVEPLTYVPSLSLGTQNDLVVRLRDLIAPFSGQIKAIVQPTTAASYPFARTLTTIFESAGWKAEFCDPPRDLGAGHNGIEIYANNPHLMSAVVDIMKAAGCTGVAGYTTEPKLEKNTSKWVQSQRFIRVRIGYRR